MTIEHTGSSIRPVANPLGSLPESQPIIGELITRPVKPHVIVNPIAVAAPCLKRLATSATLVGNTGAMERPAQKVRTPAVVGSLVCRIAYVVTAINPAAT